ncbi:ferritin-like domain-containing protein [Micromonospora sp. NPDC048170]|uniref:ferritin-like domain-containing protein n=1 Tax=Micromonospora sp. NPDC048170 TaxID=3154819 RepID=UPI0033C3E82D
MALVRYDRQIDEVTEKFLADARRSTWDPKTTARAALEKIRPTDPLLELTWNLASGSVYAEQLGLEAASVIVTESPDATAKLIGATAVADEGRHSAVFAYYAEQIGGAVAPPPEPIDDLSRGLMAMADPADRALAHMLLEGFAADEFLWFVRGLRSTGLADVYRLVRRDESRHVGLGMNYLTRGAGARLLCATSAEDLLRSEEFVVRYSDLNSIEALVRQLNAGVRPGRVANWMRRRHQKRMSIIFAVRPDGPELQEYRRNHPVWSVQ